jgi:hypothetical protein
MQEVRDGERILRFEGEAIASSSSKRVGAHRWIEFNLFKTQGGHYVLSRIGHSLLFHQEPCMVIKRNGLRPGTPDPDAMPCTLCVPDRRDAVAFYLEQPRYWAQVSDTPDAVLEALYKYDEVGARYLTKVAENLIKGASELDPAIDAIYRYQRID